MKQSFMICKNMFSVSSFCTIKLFAVRMQALVGYDIIFFPIKFNAHGFSMHL